MRIIHISYSDIDGGASRAAYRIHKAISKRGKYINLLSEMRVLIKKSNDPSVFQNKYFTSGKLKSKIISFLNKLHMISFRTENNVIHSPSAIKTKFLEKIYLDIKPEKDLIIHLHWIGNLISIEEIGDIPFPIVWTIHDQWPFCGAEHYTNELNDESIERFAMGYKKDNRPKFESGIDLNKKTWERKIRSWKKKCIFLVQVIGWQIVLGKVF